MARDLAAISFREPAKAESNLVRIEERLPAELHAPLAALLTGSPDPDGALNLLERYLSKAGSGVLSSIRAYPSALTYLVAIFSHSGFLAETFLAEPMLAVQFARDRAFTRLKSKEDLAEDYARFSTASPDVWIASQLARFKRRTELRIALKDVLGISTLAETTRELSELADVLLSNALAHCDQELRKRYGEPQFRDSEGRIAPSAFSIVSLGKLGGNELNYSSDIDLLYLYSQNGETSGGNEPDSVITNKEYFVRLANAVTRAVTQSTPHGAVYRVDLRLRPEGDMGDPAISVRSALEYYGRRARDWELQMLIKARHSAGDERLTREFLRGVEGRIYGPAVDFAAVETVLLASGRISRKLRASHREAVDVKLHAGGIRSIEFLTQCLQRLYGGCDSWVRSGGTLLALRKLNDKGHISDAEYADLTAAYEFLRKVEHRLQLDLGQQTHRLPSSPAALDKLALRVAAGRDLRAPMAPQPEGHRLLPGAALADRLDGTFRRVDEIYRAVIHPRTGPSLREDYALEPPPELLPENTASYESALRFLAANAPELATLVDGARPPERALKSAGRFLGSLLSSSSRFELAREHPAEVVRALGMIGASDYLAAQLISHPEDVTALEPRSDSPREAQMEMNLSGAPPASNAERAARAFPGIVQSPGGLTAQMALLRERYRIETMSLASRDIDRGGCIFESLKRWSRLAADAVATALEIVMRMPNGSNGRGAAAPFVVLGLGRLGATEFDLGSDADLVFVADASPGETEQFVRFSEKLIDVLASYTGEGTVFAVDTRLRPLGGEGELVVTGDALLRYAQTRAQVWEAMAYLKALPIAGDARFGFELAAKLSDALVSRFSADLDLETTLSSLRRRLERELVSTPSDLKTAPGSFYDVDYCIAFLELRHRQPAAPGRNTLERIRALSDAGALKREDAATLADGARFLRALDHAIRLVTGRPSRGLPEHTGHAAMVDELARKWQLFDSTGGRSLPLELRDVQERVRAVYRRIVEAK